MEKIRVYTKERGIRVLKEGVTLEQYRIKYPDAITVRKPPCIKTLEKWSKDCGCRAIDGCWVEPDGECEHGLPSWLVAMNFI